MNNLAQQELIAPSEAAKFLGVSVGTLAVWRCTRRYALPYIKVGAKIRYDASDLRAFLQSRKVEPRTGA